MTIDLIPAIMRRSVFGTRPLFTFNRAVWHDWCMDCVARRTLIGLGLLALGFAFAAPFIVHAQNDSVSPAEIQRETTELKAQYGAVSMQIQAIAVQLAVLNDRSKKQEEDAASDHAQRLGFMAAVGLLLMERILSALGWKLRDATRDHEPAQRRHG